MRRHVALERVLDLVLYTACEEIPMAIHYEKKGAVGSVVVDLPPVNALPVSGWFELAKLIEDAGRDTEVGAVVLAAEGRGFNAGVDIKEMQRTDGFSALLGANRGCYAAFKAVYECRVPVIAAVHGFCLGGGIGLVGNADLIIASTDATFGLPEVDRGALGAATHLSRLVPQHKMRAMVYLAETASAEELHRFGSVYAVVGRDDLRATAMAVAERIAAKGSTIIRAAKECLNGIDPVDVNRSYRFEQGFTFELNLEGVADQARDAFVGGRKDPQGGHS
jgi:enoyl-CoA hydratase